MKFLYFLFAFLLFSCLSCSKLDVSDKTNPTTSGIRFYGDQFGESLRSFEGTPDGGYMFGGNTSSSAGLGGNCFIQKCDKNGKVEWYHLYGAPLQDHIFAEVHGTSDGGFIATGTIYGNDSSNWDAAIVKTDAEGNKVWQKPFASHNFPTQNADEFYDVTETPDHGFVAVGFTNAVEENPMHIVKTDKNGDTLWTRKLLQKDQNSLGASVAIGPSGEIAIAGVAAGYVPSVDTLTILQTYDTFSIQYPTFTYLSPNGDMIMPKKTYKNLGSMPWIGNGNTWGLTYGASANFEKIVGRPDGFIIMISTNPQGLSYNNYCITCGIALSLTIFKIDFSGNVMWHQSYFGKGSGVVINDAINNQQGGQLISAGTTDASGLNYCWILNTDPGGRIIQESFTPVRGYNAWAAGAVNTGKYVAIGLAMQPILSNHAGLFGFLITDLNGKIIEQTK